MFQFGFLFGDFRFHVYQVAQRYGIFRRAHHERSRAFAFLYHSVDGTQIAHFLDDTFKVCFRIPAHDFQCQCLFRGDVLLVAYGTHAGHDAFYVFDMGDKCGIVFRRCSGVER